MHLEITHSIIKDAQLKISYVVNISELFQRAATPQT